MGHPSVWLPLTGDPATTRGRVKVDTGSTGFYRGFEFRAYVPINLTSTESLVVQVVAPVNFILTKQRLQLVRGTLQAKAYVNAVASGLPATPNAKSIGRNRMSDVPGFPDEISSAIYVPRLEVRYGKTPTAALNTASAEEVDLLMVHTGTQQGNQSSHPVAEEGEVRGLPAATYNIMIGPIPGITNADGPIGKYELIWEERPVSL